MSTPTADRPAVAVDRFTEDLTYLLAWGCGRLTKEDDRYTSLFAWALLTLQEEALRQVGETALADEMATMVMDAAHQYAARVQELGS